VGHVPPVFSLIHNFHQKRKNMPEENEPKQPDTPAQPDDKMPPEPIVREHTLTLKSGTLNYHSTTGMMPLKDDKGEHTANVFFTAYTLDDVDDPAERPLTFVFNGGPGSASVWLHLGALGPMRVEMDGEEGWMPAPPYKLVPNESTWLTQTDLVFIDPVGTGYSRATKDEHNEKFWQPAGDFASVGEVIRLYLTRYERWASPLYLAGESYGTTRSAGVAGYLIGKGIAFKGITLISTVLSFQTLRFAFSNDLPYVLYVPTYTATAWYHNKLNADLQAKPLTDVLAEVEAWVLDTYVPALMRGTSLTDDERQTIAQQLAHYTGISETFVQQANLRLEHIRYAKELLRNEGRTVGRLDSRYRGWDKDDAGENFDFDPSMTAIMPPFTAMMNDYARRTLGYETDTEYEALSYKVFGGWQWERASYPDTSEALRETMAKNPSMRILIASGYYDLATPYFAAEYTFNHMNIPAELRDNVVKTYYEAGHMLYLHLPSLAKLTDDVIAFMSAD
jgi:carboxypeptidase C (cathepsin A)